MAVAGRELAVGDREAVRPGLLQVVLEVGDEIRTVDGVKVGSIDEAVDQMRGKPGSTVKLTIVRPGRVSMST